MKTYEIECQARKGKGIAKPLCYCQKGKFFTKTKLCNKKLKWKTR